MQLPIEVLGILFLCLIFICWFIYSRLSKWWLKIRYKPNDDKSRIGEEKRRDYRATAETVASFPRPSELAERSNVPTAIIEPIGENSSRLRSLLKRTRK